jgi:hypothetical protein
MQLQLVLVNRQQAVRQVPLPANYGHAFASMINLSQIQVRYTAEADTDTKMGCNEGLDLHR